MRRPVTSLFLVPVLLLTAACQQPSESAGPPGSDAPVPGESPIAPAIEPGHPTPEHPIDLPASSPLAPAIEPGQPSPEPTIEFDPG
jgi:hypothetical protein